MLMYVYELLQRFRLYIAGLLMIALGSACFELLVEYKIKEIIDQISYDQGTGLGYLLALFVFYKMMSHLVYFFMRLLNIYYDPRLIEACVLSVYQQTLSQSLQWFDSNLAGDISSKVSDFQDGLMTLIMSLFRMATVVFTVMIGMFFLWYVNQSCAWVLLVFVFLYVPIIYWLMCKQMRYQQSYYTARQRALGVINDGIVNIFGVKIIGSVDYELTHRFKPELHLWKDKDRLRKVFDAYVVDNTDTFMTVFMSAVQIYLLASLYQSGVITAGGFAFVSILTLKIHGQLNNFLETLLFSVNPSIAKLQSAYDRLFASIDVKDSADAGILSDVCGRICFQSVSFKYAGDHRYVLKDFDLAIEPGERVGLVGISGAGKTTIMKCLLRYFDVDSGDVLVDGHSIYGLKQASLRSHIAIIPQDITMFHRSISENLALANPEASLEAIQNACKKAKIHIDIMAMPKQYDTIVGERGVKLSGGQRQRIAIARAILKDAPILILDEATSSLDTPTEKLIQNSIDDILEKSGATVIAIAHRLSTLKHMDRIIVLDKGKIVEQGTHQGLIRKKGGHYKKLWDMQVI